MRDRLGRASAGRLLNRGSEAEPGRRIGVSGIPRFSAGIRVAAAAAVGCAVVDATAGVGGALVLFLEEMAGACKMG